MRFAQVVINHSFAVLIEPAPVWELTLASEPLDEGRPLSRYGYSVKACLGWLKLRLGWLKLQS